MPGAIQWAGLGALDVWVTSPTRRAQRAQSRRANLISARAARRGLQAALPGPFRERQKERAPKGPHLKHTKGLLLEERHLVVVALPTAPVVDINDHNATRRRIVLHHDPFVKINPRRLVFNTSHQKCFIAHGDLSRKSAGGTQASPDRLRPSARPQR